MRRADRWGARGCRCESPYAPRGALRGSGGRPTNRPTGASTGGVPSRAHPTAGALHPFDERSERALHVAGAHPGDGDELARFVVWAEVFEERDRVFRIDLRSELHANHVFDAAEELDVRAVEGARPLANPRQM